MTTEEAKKVAEVMATADGCCRICADELAEEMLKVFPNHDGQALVDATFDKPIWECQ